MKMDFMMKFIGSWIMHCKLKEGSQKVLSICTLLLNVITVGCLLD